MALIAARVQGRGQVTLPKALRDRTGIKPGDDPIFRRLENGRFEASVESVMTIAEMIDTFREDGALGDYEAELRDAEAELADNYR